MMQLKCGGVSLVLIAASLLLDGLLIFYWKILSWCPITLVTVLGLLIYYLLSDNDDHLMINQNVKVDPPIPQVMVLGLNLFPLVKKIFKALPTNTRRNIAVKMV